MTSSDTVGISGLRSTRSSRDNKFSLDSDGSCALLIGAEAFSTSSIDAVFFLRAF